MLETTSPISDEEVEALYTETFAQKNFNSIQWPTIEEAERAWTKGELVLEPGESHSETIEYIVATSGYESFSFTPTSTIRHGAQALPKDGLQLPYVISCIVADVRSRQGGHLCRLETETIGTGS